METGTIDKEGYVLVAAEVREEVGHDERLIKDEIHALMQKLLKRDNIESGFKSRPR